MEDNIKDLVESGTALAIKENSKKLDRWLYLGWAFFALITISIIWIMYKIVKYDAFNNTIRAIGC